MGDIGCVHGGVARRSRVIARSPADRGRPTMTMLIQSTTIPPVFDLEGAYVPAWLPAIGLGFLGMVIFREVLVALRLHDRLPVPALVHLAAIVLFACLAWFWMT